MNSKVFKKFAERNITINFEILQLNAILFEILQLFTLIFGIFLYLAINFATLCYLQNLLQYFISTHNTYCNAIWPNLAKYYSTRVLERTVIL